MTSTDTYIKQLAESNPLREPTLRSAIQAQELPPGSRGLDAGCGIDFQACARAGGYFFPRSLCPRRRVAGNQ